MPCTWPGASIKIKKQKGIHPYHSRRNPLRRCLHSSDGQTSPPKRHVRYVLHGSCSGMLSLTTVNVTRRNGSAILDLLDLRPSLERTRACQRVSLVRKGRVEDAGSANSAGGFSNDEYRAMPLDGGSVDSVSSIADTLVSSPLFGKGPG